MVADWWLGDTEDRFFKAAESAIEQEWGQKPLFIREGGSVPAIRWLEKRLKAAAVHIPMGQVWMKLCLLLNNPSLYTVAK